MNKPSLIILSCLLGFCLLSPVHGRADWINLSGAENARNIALIHIERDRVRIELEIFVNDIVTFDRLLPDEFFEGTRVARSLLAKRMREFSEKDFQIIDDRGRKLRATLNRVEPRLRTERPSPFAGKINPVTRQIVPGPPADKRVLFAELVYPFRERPGSLTIVPPLDVESGTGRVAIGFLTYHLGVQVHVFRFLSEPSTVSLDWDDPWYSAFESKALKRWQRGGVMSFLYIEPYEVRHEILARVKDLSAWMDPGLRGKDYIEEDENEPLKKRVGEFFLKQDKVRIDGRQVRPILDRTAFVKYAMTGSTFLVEPERLPINTAMVGVIVTYLIEGMPQQVTNEWSLWSERIQAVPADAIDPAGPFPSYLTPDDNVLTWTNFLKGYRPPTVAEVMVDEALTTLQMPVASLLCLFALVPVVLQTRRQRRRPGRVALLAVLAALLVAGVFLLRPFLGMSVTRPAAMAPKMSDQDAVVVLNDLLRNIYRSFDFREEEDVYNRLATSVAGDLLSEIYLQNRESLIVTQAGGARARVQEVEILDVDVNPLQDRSLGRLFRARWTAMGSVGHWGHIHTRKNQYDANIAVEPVDGAWKITNLELLEEKRIDP